MLIFLYQAKPLSSVWTACEKSSHVQAKATDQDATSESWLDNHKTPLAQRAMCMCRLAPCYHDRTAVRCLKLMIKGLIKFPWCSCLPNLKFLKSCCKGMSQTFVMVLTCLWFRRAEKELFCAYFPLSRTHTHITEEGKSPCQGQKCECCFPLFSPSLSVLVEYAFWSIFNSILCL